MSRFWLGEYGRALGDLTNRAFLRHCRPIEQEPRRGPGVDDKNAGPGLKISNFSDKNVHNVTFFGPFSGQNSDAFFV